MPIPIFDTHAHLDLEPFDGDRQEAVRRMASGTFPGGLPPACLEADLDGETFTLTGVLIPGIEPAAWHKTLAAAALSPLFHAAVAVHPNHAAGLTDADWRQLAELAHRQEVIAIGETGLDCYWDNVPLDEQIESFRRHLILSHETDKPILIHCRDAWEPMLPILRQAPPFRGVIHAFSGTPEQMAACVELGCMISFAGSVTYRNSKFAPLWEAAKHVPDDRLLIETDAPFMVPHPLRGKVNRNEPLLSALTAQRLAELRNVPLLTIGTLTSQNALRFFRSCKFACRRLE